MTDMKKLIQIEKDVKLLAQMFLIATEALNRYNEYPDDIAGIALAKIEVLKTKRKDERNET